MMEKKWREVKRLSVSHTFSKPSAPNEMETSRFRKLLLHWIILQYKIYEPKNIKNEIARIYMSNFPFKFKGTFVINY
jgi:hypothetical protein